MIQKELLDLLQCPECQRPLQLVDETLLSRLNEAIIAGGVKNQAGCAVELPLEAALLADGGPLVYPIVDGIPVMLLEEAIPIEQIESGSERRPT